MSDVFISYSRLDKDFVGNLREALVSQEQDVWIDWESIPPSQVWWAEIKKGISETNNFVVVLSPNSMASPICHMEIEYARQWKKRIIPVWHLDFERDDALTRIAARLANPEQVVTRELWGNRQPHDMFDSNVNKLKHINYFFFKPDDDFQAHFDELFAVIRTDYQHKEQHTSLELRAQTWSRREKNPSFLLIYDELAQAQEWLQSAEDKNPVPTRLQREYIQASEKRTRQLQNIRRASVIGSVVAVLAILFAIGASYLGTSAVNDANNQLSTATIQQGAAEQNAAQANTQVAEANLNATSIARTIVEREALIESLRLGAEATILNNSAGNPEVAALLAIRALNEAYSPQSDAALVRATDQLYTRQLFSAHSSDVNSVVFSPDGNYILTGSGEHWREADDFTARLWDAATGEELRQFSGHTSDVNSVAFSLDGAQVLTGSSDNTARLWDAVTAEELALFRHESAVVRAAFSPAGTQILTGSWDGTARLWDAETHAELQRFIGVGDSITSVAFSPNGETVVTAGCFERIPAEISCYRSGLQVWDVATGVELRQFSTHTGTVNSVVFSPDGSLLLTGGDDNTAGLWNVESGEMLRLFTGHSDKVQSVAFSPDASLVLTGSWDHTARLWDVSDATELRRYLGHSDSIESVAFSLDGAQVLTGSGDNTARLWDARVGATPRRYAAHVGPIFSVAFSPDRASIATGGWDHTVRVWNTETGQEHRSFRHSANISSVAFSPDGSLVLTGHGDSTIQLWDTRSGNIVQRFIRHRELVTSVAFNSSGTRIVTGAIDGYILVWDVRAGALLQEFGGPPGASIRIDFSPDDSLIIIGGLSGRTAWLRDAVSGDTVRHYSGHTRNVTDVAFSPAGEHILTGSLDRTARLWNTATGEVLRQYIGHNNVVNSVVFSSDGKYVLTGSTDGTARLWDTYYQDFITYACTRVFRDFTEDERIEYGIPDDTPTCPQFAGNSE